VGLATLAAFNTVPAAVGYFFPDGGPVVVALVLLGLGLSLVLTAVAVARRR
jgi:hypothetical protein